MHDFIFVKTTLPIDGERVTKSGEARVSCSDAIERGVFVLNNAVILRLQLADDEIVEVHLPHTDDANTLAKALKQAARQAERTLKQFINSPWGKLFVGLEALIDHDPDLLVGIEGDPLSRQGTSRYDTDARSAHLAFSANGDLCRLVFDTGQAWLYRNDREVRAWTMQSPPDAVEWFKQIKAAATD